MARNFREFAPGLADVTPTPDYCETIFWEQRQNASSERSEIYGAHCGRWHFPTYGAQGHGSKCCDVQHPHHLEVSIWSAGGPGWGSCCCMGGAPAGGGGYMKACYEPKPGWYCYVVAGNGCCHPSSVGTRCYSFWKHWNQCDHMCMEGGWCGFSHCYFDYCCNNRNCCSFDWDGNLRDKTQFRYGCSCNWTWNHDPCSIYDAHIRGRRPWDRSHTNKCGWNAVPGGNKRNNPYSTSACKEQMTGLISGMNWPGDCRADAPECIQRHANVRKGFHVGFVAVEHCGHQQYATCGGKRYGTAGSGIRTSGPRWINFTAVNADAWGGWNWSRWFLCHNGSNNNLCYSNVRTVGFAGQPARVCAGGCCCGGWGGLGMVLLRYK